jgi:hypothetical protein
VTEEELQELYRQRKEAYVEACESYGLDASDGEHPTNEGWERDEPQNVGQYLLVQRQWLPTGDRYWISTHESLQDATTYHEGDVDDWHVEALIDLDRGTFYCGEVSVRFVHVCRKCHHACPPTGPCAQCGSDRLEATDRLCAECDAKEREESAHA